jgi:ABC-2 type transport system ATP-binding protein
MTVLLTTHYMEEADLLCDRIALLHLGRVMAVGSPGELKRAFGPDATLEDVFRHHTGNELDGRGEARPSIRSIRSVRRTAGRLG